MQANQRLFYARWCPFVSDGSGCVVDQVEQRRALVIEGRPKLKLIRLVSVQAAAQVVKALVRRQGCRGEDYAGFFIPDEFCISGPMCSGAMLTASRLCWLPVETSGPIHVVAARLRDHPCRLASSSERRRKASLRLFRASSSSSSRFSWPTSPASIVICPPGGEQQDTGLVGFFPHYLHIGPYRQGRGSVGDALLLP